MPGIMQAMTVKEQRGLRAMTLPLGRHGRIAESITFSSRNHGLMAPARSNIAQLCATKKSTRYGRPTNTEAPIMELAQHKDVLLFKSHAWFGLLSAVFSTSAFADGNRRFNTRAAVEMAYFGTLIAAQPFDVDDDGVLSPDGRWAAPSGVLRRFAS